MSDTEVRDSGASRGEDDVLRVRIPVDDSGGVDRGEMPVEGEPGRLGGGQPGVLGIRVCCEEGDEAGPVYAGGKLDLSAKAGPEFIVLGLCGVDHLHGDTEAGRTVPIPPDPRRPMIR
ncbi:hypothetical protein HHL19_15955 [Streptomyces sp. R302]|uniref:hypothetical protein n=1 Tax=unclassified Streptomyces TaxID=2593676 RepID=UPI00145E36D0|nr:MULTISPECIES: hypothetical protein [unclassified Streptomyces]NML51561.1 hypothetical protein [Streptomyces sp. R301]NML80139.1 hypothetical protein [Streptomyces sp. R302]